MKKKSKGFILKLLVLVVALAIFPLSAAMAASIDIEPLFTPAPGGTPLYAWGANNSGQLGLGNSGAATRRLVPTRVGDAENWTQVSSGTGGSAALNAEGHLYTWGGNWTATVMGQGGNPANPGTGNITVPTRVGTADNWRSVLIMGSVASAINDQGHLYTWGQNNNGQLGLGDTANRNVPTRVGTASNWVMMRVYQHASLAINDQGHLYTWGSNANGQLGQGTTGGPNQLIPQRVDTASSWKLISSSSTGAVSAINDQGHLYTWGANASGQLGFGDYDSRNVPTRVGTASNWVDVIGTAGGGSAMALNSDGEVYTWGNPINGRLGRVVDAANPQYLPGRIEGNNWIAIGAGNGHNLAMTEDMRIYSWGNNTDGQLGIGTMGGYEDTPQFVLQAFGLAGFTQSGTGHVSMALIRTLPAAGEVDIEKRLQKPEGTDLLGDITFTFTFEPHSFNHNEALVSQLPNIPNRTITLNAASPSLPPSGGITTSVNLADALEDIEFTQMGIHSWIVREAPTTGVAPPSSVADSQAAYELRVYISHEGGLGGAYYIYAITIHRLYSDAGVAINPPVKVDDLVFTNTYTRTVTAAEGALVVSKSVTGPFADLTTAFDFEVTLTRTAVCPVGTTFTGQVYNANNTPSGTPITFTSGTMQTVNLTHGQRLVFDEFVVGTRFTVTELASPGFIASVNLVVNGSTVAVPGNTNHNQDLSIGGPHIAGSSQNSAAFTNAHNYVPTGLSVSNTLTVLPFIAATGLIFLLASKHRKRIEQLPLV